MNATKTKTSGNGNNGESIFAGQTGPFAEYRLDLRFRNRVLGGKPKDAKMVQKWIEQQVQGRDRKDATRDEVYDLIDRSRAKELQRLVKTNGVSENGDDPDGPSVDDMTPEEVQAEISKFDLMLASEEQVDRSGNGFYSDENGLYLGGYQLKAAIKESTNIVFVGEKFGPTKKGAKNFVAERVFVKEEEIYLGKPEADGIQVITGTVTGPQGKRSIISMYEFVEKVDISATIRVTRDGVPQYAWPQILMSMEENGLGAARGQGFGTFNVTGWEKTAEYKALK